MMIQLYILNTVEWRQMNWPSSLVLFGAHHGIYEKIDKN